MLLLSQSSSARSKFHRIESKPMALDLDFSLLFFLMLVAQSYNSQPLIAVELRQADGNCFWRYFQGKNSIFFGGYYVAVYQIYLTKQKEWNFSIIIYYAFSNLTTVSFVVIRFGRLTHLTAWKSTRT